MSSRLPLLFKTAVGGASSTARYGVRQKFRALLSLHEGLMARRNLTALAPSIERLKPYKPALVQSRFYPTTPLSPKQIDFLEEYEGEFQSSARKQKDLEEKKVMFLVNHGMLDLDLQNQKLEVVNMDDLKQKFFAEFKSDEEDFVKILEIIKEITQKVFKENPKLQDIRPVQLFKSESQTENQDEEEIADKIFHIYAEQRRVVLAHGIGITELRSGVKDTKFYEYFIEEIISELARIRALEDAINALGFNKDKVLERLKMSEQAYAISNYPRDDVLILGEKMFRPHDHIKVFIHKAAQIDKGVMLQELINSLFVSEKDLEESGYRVMTMPFLLQGGNVVKSGNKVYFTISNSLYKSHDKDFFAPFVIKEKPHLITNMQEYSDLIKEWFKSQGLEAIEVKRNPNIDSSDSKEFVKCYHLDVFMNILKDLLIICEDSADKSSILEIEKDFEEDKIFRLTEDERSHLATNFIALNDKNVIFGNVDPEPLMRLVKFFNKHGVNVAFCPINFSRHKTDGVRCGTAELEKIFDKQDPEKKVSKPQSQQVKENITSKSH